MDHDARRSAIHKHMIDHGVRYSSALRCFEAFDELAAASNNGDAVFDPVSFAKKLRVVSEFYLDGAAGMWSGGPAGTFILGVQPHVTVPAWLDLDRLEPGERREAEDWLRETWSAGEDVPREWSDSDDSRGVALASVRGLIGSVTVAPTRYRGSLGVVFFRGGGGIEMPGCVLGAVYGPLAGPKARGYVMRWVGQVDAALAAEHRAEAAPENASDATFNDERASLAAKRRRAYLRIISFDPEVETPRPPGDDGGAFPFPMPWPFP